MVIHMYNTSSYLFTLVKMYEWDFVYLLSLLYPHLVCVCLGVSSLLFLCALQPCMPWKPRGVPEPFILLVNERANLHLSLSFVLCLSTAFTKTVLVIKTVLHLEADSKTAQNLNSSSEYLRPLIRPHLLAYVLRVCCGNIASSVSPQMLEKQWPWPSQ